MTQNIKTDKNLYKTLGKTSATLISHLSREGKTVFSTSEVSQILGTDKTKVTKLLHDLAEKGWVQRIEKGKYILVPLTVDPTQPYTENQFIIAANLIHPYYIGYWNMLNYYGYTEQLPNMVFIASTKRKREITITGVKYKFIKISPEKMFGLSEIRIDDVPITVSDNAKTLLDCLDHPEYCGGIIEAAKGIWNAREEVDFEKMLYYVRKMKNSAVAKRLGYLLEVLELDNRIEIEGLNRIIRKGFSLLDPLLPKTGHYVSRWNLVVNISKEELLSFKST